MFLRSQNTLVILSELFQLFQEACKRKKKAASAAEKAQLPAVSQTRPTPQLPKITMASELQSKKERDQAQKEAQKESKNKLKSVVDLDKQCGVAQESSFCSRAITCKTHSIMQKKQVLRSDTYNYFVRIYQSYEKLIHLYQAKQSKTKDLARQKPQIAIEPVNIEKLNDMLFVSNLKRERSEEDFHITRAFVWMTSKGEAHRQPSIANWRKAQSRKLIGATLASLVLNNQI